ncbi:MAPEG family protein [Ferrovibrio sp.]|uniref:MAPEG family protein n=1 Tax=Ferrovibrio sp. TaxID=1917215 RepID=UPI00311E13A9
MLMPFFVTPLYAALCAILLVMLSLRVVRYRRRHLVSLGDGGHADLQQAIRAQANLTEYAPMGLLLLLLLEVSHQAPVWALHLLGAMLFAGRAIHAWGVLASVPGRRPSPARGIGIAFTWSMLLVTAVWLLIIAVGRLGQV